MSEEELHEEQNVLLRGMLGVLKIAGGAAVLSLLGGFGVLVSDHFDNHERDRKLEKILLNQDQMSAQVRALGNPRNRWSYGMQANFAQELASRNTTLVIPSVESIRKSHDLEEN